MRDFLSRSISSFNQNKLNGLLAEVDLRAYLSKIGFADRISPGGWIARRVGPGEFGHKTAVLFPEVLEPDKDYPQTRQFPKPPLGLHTICSTFHQSGIHAFFCSATVATEHETQSVAWQCVQLGIPIETAYEPLATKMKSYFRARDRAYNFLRHKTDTSSIPDGSVPAEFSKEHLRVAFQSGFTSEISDVDGILWGQQITYPLEIKEKTAATNNKLGAFFGLDIGPFVKLAFYAAKRGNLHSLFVVREIDNPVSRNLVNWWFITFDELAQYASWVQQAGGTSMTGGASAVVKIPKAEFRPLDRSHLEQL